jgi:hypothetical protein
MSIYPYTLTDSTRGQKLFQNKRNSGTVRDQALQKLEKNIMSGIPFWLPLQFIIINFRIIIGNTEVC